LENIGDQRTNFGAAARKALNSPSATTFENNEKIWPRHKAEIGFSAVCGGGYDIPTTFLEKRVKTERKLAIIRAFSLS